MVGCNLILANMLIIFNYWPLSFYNNVEITILLQLQIVLVGQMQHSQEAQWWRYLVIWIFKLFV